MTVSKKDQFNEAKTWAYENLNGKKVFQKDINDFIQFNKASIDHIIFAKSYEAKVKMIYSASQLIENSTLFSIEKDKKNRPEIKSVYKFVSHWVYENKKYLVYIVVRETGKGKFYYDHGLIKERP